MYKDIIEKMDRSAVVALIVDVINDNSIVNMETFDPFNSPEDALTLAGILKISISFYKSDGLWIVEATAFDYLIDDYYNPFYMADMTDGAQVAIRKSICMAAAELAYHERFLKKLVY